MAIFGNIAKQPKWPFWAKWLPHVTARDGYIIQLLARDFRICPKMAKNGHFGHFQTKMQKLSKWPFLGSNSEFWRSMCHLITTPGMSRNRQNGQNGQICQNTLKLAIFHPIFRYWGSFWPLLQKPHFWAIFWADRPGASKNVHLLTGFDWYRKRPKWPKWPKWPFCPIGQKWNIPLLIGLYCGNRKT